MINGLMTKLSRSKLELFIECPRCFWLDLKKGAKRPGFPPYTINNAVDYLLKQEFDVHRKKGTRHPAMERHNINAVPYRTPEIDKWRHNFTGVQYHHKPSDFLMTGAVDDVWVNPGGELIVVDYKATGANQHRIYDSYRRQMEIYQWLLRRNELPVASTGYFVFAKVNKGNGFGSGIAALSFDLLVEACEGDDAWIEPVLPKVRRTLDSDEIPRQSETCEYCRYRESASRF